MSVTGVAGDVGVTGGRVRTADGGAVYYRPSRVRRGDWKVLRCPPERTTICEAPYAAPAERMRAFTWRAPDGATVRRRVVARWGLTIE